MNVVAHRCDFFFFFFTNFYLRKIKTPHGVLKASILIKVVSDIKFHTTVNPIIEMGFITRGSAVPREFGKYTVIELMCPIQNAVIFSLS